VFDDFRSLDEPEAPVTTTKRFRFDRPGHVKAAAVAVPDLGSLRERDPVVSGDGGDGGPLPPLPGLPGLPGLPAACRSSVCSPTRCWWARRSRSPGTRWP
jgi:hypothetical protein